MQVSLLTISYQHMMMHVHAHRTASGMHAASGVAPPVPAGVEVDWPHSVHAASYQSVDRTHHKQRTTAMAQPPDRAAASLVVCGMDGPHRS